MSSLPSKIRLTELECAIMLDRLGTGDTIADALTTSSRDYPYSYAFWRSTHIRDAGGCRADACGGCTR